MKSYTEAQVEAAANVLLSQEGDPKRWDTNSTGDQSILRDRVTAILHAADAASKVYEEEHIISARILKRREEWVLELSGAINDTAFNVRHATPGTIPPEDVVDLANHYAWHTRLVAAGLAKEEDI
jgi:hypothetical protein